MTRASKPALSSIGDLKRSSASVELILSRLINAVWLHLGYHCTQIGLALANLVSIATSALYVPTAKSFQY